MSQIGDFGFSSIIDNSLMRFAPQPKSRNAATFTGVLKGVSSVLTSAASSVTGGIDPLYADLISQQIQAQQQMQLVTFESNIEKSKHETQMSAIRNIRVG